MSDAAVKMVCDTVIMLASGGASLFFLLFFMGAFDRD